MANRIGEHLRGNVVGYVALFVALGGSAYAVTNLDRNSVRSKHIVNGQVKEKDTRNGHFAPGPKDCPAGTQLVEAACIESNIRATDENHPTAEFICSNADRRLPSVSELQSLRLQGETLGRSGGFAYELTSESDIDENGSNLAYWRQVVHNGGSAAGWVDDLEPRPFRCVAMP